MDHQASCCVDQKTFATFSGTADLDEAKIQLVQFSEELEQGDAKNHENIDYLDVEENDVVKDEVGGEDVNIFSQ